MCGRRIPVVGAAESGLLVATPNSALLEYDEPALRLTNSALDAELSLSDAALAGTERNRLPPVEATCRAGNVECSFTIMRRQQKFGGDHEWDPTEHVMTWWCVNYAKGVAHLSGSPESTLAGDVDASAWRHLDRALGEALKTFTLLMPRGRDKSEGHSVHLTGGRFGSPWRRQARQVHVADHT